jgi:uncharacterized protein YdeI (YjbR/CyaY-like superfamily)
LAVTNLPPFSREAGLEPMIRTEDLAQVAVTSAKQLRDWLMIHHAQENSIWLVTYKKNMGQTYVSTSEILDEILCFGWIDGIRRKLDADRTMQLLSPRRTQVWAKTYKDRVVRLTQQGRMHPAGLAAVALSQANGLWSHMDDVDALLIPDDLAGQLAKLPLARVHFEAFAPSYRRNVLRWLALAKTPATRTKRLAQIADRSARAEKLAQM